MNKIQYINSILKRVAVTDLTKNRIRADLLTEFEALEEQGISLEDIIAQKGSPEEVAKEFNANYSDTEMQRQYHLQKGLKIAAISLLSLAILLVVAGTVLINPSFWYSPEISSGESMAVIGGADGPTAIFVTGILNTVPLAFRLLVLGCILLALCGALLAAFGILRKKY